MRLGQRRAVHGNERPARARRAVVNRARQQLLARARLAQQQHRRLRRRRLHHDLHRPPPRQRLADQRPALLGRQLGAQRPVLLHQRALLDRLADDPHQVGALDRLGHEIVGALLHRLDRVFDRPVGGHQHRLGLGRHALARAKQVHARHPRHHQVGQQHRHRLAPDDLQRLASRPRGQHPQRLPFQDLLQRIDDRRLVIDDQDRGCPLRQTASFPSLRGTSTAMPSLLARIAQVIEFTSSRYYDRMATGATSAARVTTRRRAARGVPVCQGGGGR